MTNACTAHLLATVNSPLQFDDLIDANGVPHSYILHDAPSNSFYIIFCKACHKSMHFGRNGTDILEVAEKHFSLRNHRKAFDQCNSNTDLVPDLSELYHRIENCNLEQVLENNISFVCSRIKPPRNSTPKGLLNVLRNKLPGEALSEVRRQDILNKGKAAGQATRSTAL